MNRRQADARVNAPPAGGPMNARPNLLAAPLRACCSSGCAVGPDFVASAAPDADGYTAEKLSANVGLRRGAGRRKPAARQGHGHSRPMVEAVPFRPLNSLIETGARQQPRPQGGGSGAQGGEGSRGGAEGLLLSDRDRDAQRLPAIAGDGTIAPVLNSAPRRVYNLYTPQVNISYHPDIWGLNRRTVELLQAQADMQRFQTEAAYLTLTSNIVVGAVQEASYRGQIEATKKIIKTMGACSSSSASEKALGQVAEADVALQEAALAQAEAPCRCWKSSWRSSATC